MPTYKTSAANPPLCPRCGAPEINEDTGMLFVRGNKVHTGGHWHSQCLVCSGAYENHGEDWEYDESRHDRNAGWYAETGASFARAARANLKGRAAHQIVLKTA